MKGFCLVFIILGLNTFSAFCQNPLIKNKRGTQLDSLLEKAYYLDSIRLDSAFVANKGGILNATGTAGESIFWRVDK